MQDLAVYRQHLYLGLSLSSRGAPGCALFLFVICAFMTQVLEFNPTSSATELAQGRKRDLGGYCPGYCEEGKEKDEDPHLRLRSIS